MKEHRHARARDRKSHLSPDAERLVSAALGLSNSGSRLEDRFWEAQLSARLDRLLDSGHVQAVYDALDRNIRIIDPRTFEEKDLRKLKDSFPRMPELSAGSQQTDADVPAGKGRIDADLLVSRGLTATP